MRNAKKFNCVAACCENMFIFVKQNRWNFKAAGLSCTPTKLMMTQVNNRTLGWFTGYGPTNPQIAASEWKIQDQVVVYSWD